MPSEIRNEDLTPRQRRVYALHKLGSSTAIISASTGLSRATVTSALHEIAVKAGRSGNAKPSSSEHIANARDDEERLASGGRCPRCKLCLPHVCVTLAADARQGEVSW